MSESTPTPPLKFWTEFIRPYQIRSMWMLAVSMPILFGFIAYTWHTQTPIEYLHWLPENIGAVILLANMLYAIFLFCRATWFTFKTMTTHVDILGEAINDVRSGKDFNQPKPTGAQVLQLLMPVGLIFSHVFMMCLICLPSSLLMNAPYID